MILNWLIYLVVTCAFIGAAALLAERALGGRVAARFVWLTALLVSVVLPFAVSAWTREVAESPSSITLSAATQRAGSLEPPEVTAVRATEADETTSRERSSWRG